MSMYDQGVPGWENLYSMIQWVGACTKQKYKNPMEPLKILHIGCTLPLPGMCLEHTERSEDS